MPLPRPSGHSPGSRARVVAPSSRSAALRHAAASARRRQQRLPILCQRRGPVSGAAAPALHRPPCTARPGPAPAACPCPRPEPKRAARGRGRGLPRAGRGATGTRRWPGGLHRWAGAGWRPRPVSMHPFPPTLTPTHINTRSPSTVRRVEPRWREPGRPFSLFSFFSVPARMYGIPQESCFPGSGLRVPLPRPAHPVACFPQVSPVLPELWLLQVPAN